MKQISYNYEKLSPDRDSLREEEEKGTKRNNEDKALRTSTSLSQKRKEENNPKPKLNLQEKGRKFIVKFSSILDQFFELSNK